MIFLRSIGLNHYHLVLVVNLWSGEQGGIFCQMWARLPVPTSYVAQSVAMNILIRVRKAFLWLVMAPLVFIFRSLYSHSLSEFLCSHNAQFKFLDFYTTWLLRTRDKIPDDTMGHASCVELTIRSFVSTDFNLEALFPTHATTLEYSQKLIHYCVYFRWW